jgi:methionine synthase II (cobalamin-independent)
MNQVKTTVDPIIRRKDYTKERLSEMEDKIKEVLHTNNNKGKMNTHEFNIQKLWDTINSLNLKIYRVEEGAEI